MRKFCAQRKQSDFETIVTLTSEMYNCSEMEGDFFLKFTSFVNSADVKVVSVEQ